MKNILQSGSQRISGRSILQILVVVYILASLAYITLNQFRGYQNHLIQEAYLESRVATIEELLDEAEASCQPFPVYAGDRQVNLINFDCLLPETQGEENGQLQDGLSDE